MLVRLNEGFESRLQRLSKLQQRDEIDVGGTADRRCKCLI